MGHSPSTGAALSLTGGAGRQGFPAGTPGALGCGWREQSPLPSLGVAWRGSSPLRGEKTVNRRL